MAVIPFTYEMTRMVAGRRIAIAPVECQAWIDADPHDRSQWYVRAVYFAYSDVIEIAESDPLYKDIERFVREDAYTCDNADEAFHESRSDARDADLERLADMDREAA